jgi:hypothetical protein
MPVWVTTVNIFSGQPAGFFKIWFRAEKPTRVKVAGRRTQSAQSLPGLRIFERF